MHKFISKSSDLRTQDLPEGQTDAELFVKRNIDISSIYAAILYSNSKIKMDDFSFTCYCACMARKRREVKRSQGHGFALFNNKGGEIFLLKV